jgi:hypothetical protein
MSPEPESKPWWQTLSGLLTAGAAIITAVTGLLVAVHQTGCLDRSAKSPTPSESRPQPAGEKTRPTDVQSAASHPAASVPSSRLLTLPEMSQVRMGDTIIYKLLSARVEPYSPDKVALRLKVRMTNNGNYPANFWSSSFRLLVDGALQAPTNLLDEILASNSSKDGDVEFVVPANVSTVGLQMGDVGEGKGTIDLNLQKP